MADTMDIYIVQKITAYSVLTLEYGSRRKLPLLTALENLLTNLDCRGNIYPLCTLVSVRVGNG